MDAVEGSVALLAVAGATALLLARAANSSRNDYDSGGSRLTGGSNSSITGSHGENDVSELKVAAQGTAAPALADRGVALHRVRAPKGHRNALVCLGPVPEARSEGALPDERSDAQPRAQSRSQSRLRRGWSALDGASSLNHQRVTAIAARDGMVVVCTADGDCYQASEKLGAGLSLCLALACERALRGVRVCSVACGPHHFAALSGDGDLFTWGLGESGQLGHGRAVDEREPRKVAALVAVRLARIACGAQHTLAAAEDGSVYSWGAGDRDGRLGHRDGRSLSEPRRVLTFPAWSKRRGHGPFVNRRFVELAAGDAHSVALDSRGHVFCFGANAMGQCGLGTESGGVAPAHPLGTEPAEQPAALCSGGAEAPEAPGTEPGLSPACAGASLAQVSDRSLGAPAHASDRILADSLAGQAAIWCPQPVNKLYEVRVVAVRCAKDYSLALTAEGTLVSWGWGPSGELGRPTPTPLGAEPTRVELRGPGSSWLQALQMDCGDRHAAAVCADGQVFGWGAAAQGALGVAEVPAGEEWRPRPLLVGKAAASTNVVGGTAEEGDPELGAVACGKSFTLYFRNTRPPPPSGAASPAAPPASPAAPRAATTPVLSSVAVALSRFDLHAEAAPREVVESPRTPVPRRRMLLLREHQEELHQELQRPPRHPLAAKAEQDRLAAEAEARERWESRVLPNWSVKRGTPKTLAAWRAGITPTVRAAVWPLAIGNALRVTKPMYYAIRDQALELAVKARTRAARGREAVPPGSAAVVELGFAAAAEESDDALAQELDRQEALLGERYRERVSERDAVHQQVEADLARTFPQLGLFAPGGALGQRLCNVLLALAAHRPDLGYVQGMSYLAAALLMHLPTEYVAFQALANLVVREHLFGFFRLDRALIYEYYDIFERALVEHGATRDVAAQLLEQGCHPHLYAYSWMQTLFLKVLHPALAFRAIDCFLLDGFAFVARCSVALVRLFKPLLLGRPFDECVRLLSCSPGSEHIWAREANEQALFAAVAEVKLSNKLQEASIELASRVFY
jgi:alpha-tubulin suppressor-like RCC1 family protein